MNNWYLNYNSQVFKLRLPGPFSLLVDGYIKTTAVEIDYDSLKRKKNSLNAVPPRLVEDDQEVYDDVAEQDAPNRCVTHKV